MALDTRATLEFPGTDIIDFRKWCKIREQRQNFLAIIDFVRMSHRAGRAGFTCLSGRQSHPDLCAHLQREQSTATVCVRSIKMAGRLLFMHRAETSFSPPSDPVIAGQIPTSRPRIVRPAEMIWSENFRKNHKWYV